jgi:hypothetical protein
MEISSIRIDLASCGICYSELVPAGFRSTISSAELVPIVVMFASTLIVALAFPFNKSRVLKPRFSLKTELKSKNIATQQIKQRGSDGVDA